MPDREAPPVPEVVAGEPDLTRAAARIVVAFRDNIAYDNPARLMAPSKADMERVRMAIIANSGKWHDIRDWVAAVTRKATERDRDPPVSSVRYGLKAWENDAERKRKEHEKRVEREPDVYNPVYYQPASVGKDKELTAEEHEAVMKALAEIRAKLEGQ